MAPYASSFDIQDTGSIDERRKSTNYLPYFAISISVSWDLHPSLESACRSQCEYARHKDNIKRPTRDCRICEHVFQLPTSPYGDEELICQKRESETGVAVHLLGLWESSNRFFDRPKDLYFPHFDHFNKHNLHKRSRYTHDLMSGQPIGKPCTAMFHRRLRQKRYGELRCDWLKLATGDTDWILKRRIWYPIMGNWFASCRAKGFHVQQFLVMFGNGLWGEMGI